MKTWIIQTIIPYNGHEDEALWQPLPDNPEFNSQAAAFRFIEQSLRARKSPDWVCTPWNGPHDIVWALRFPYEEKILLAYMADPTNKAVWAYRVVAK